MKKLLVILFLLCATSVSAQDVIVKKDGSTILSKVLEVGQEVIKYKKFNNLDGPTYTIQKSELQSINYQNGAKDTFSAPVREENRYQPHNQNDGTQQYNDRALLALEAASHKSTQTAKTLRWIGGIGGISLLGAGILLFATGEGQHTTESAAVLFSSLPWSAVFFTTAYYIDKKAEKKGILGSTIYHYDLNFSNGSTLSLGADLLSDRTQGSNTIGLGLRYNF